MKKDQSGLTTKKVVKTIVTGAAIGGATYVGKKMKENKEFQKQVASMTQEVFTSILKWLIG